MIPGLIGLAASLIPSIYQGITGSKQSKQADAISPGERPTYEIPSGAKSALGLQSMLASGNRPGYELAKEDAMASTAGLIGATMRGAMPNTQVAYRNLTNALGDINMDNQAFRERQMGNLINSYSQYADYEDKAFDINQMQPYEYALGQSMALKDASIQNTYGALDSGAASAIKALEMINPDAVSGVFGGGKTGAPQSDVDFGSSEGYSVYQRPERTSQATGAIGDPTMDAKLAMLIKNPEAMASLFRLFSKPINFK